MQSKEATENVEKHYEDNLEFWLTKKDVQKCIDWFRSEAWKFAREIAPVYRLLQWSWGTKLEHIPEQEDIAGAIYELIEHLEYDGLPPATELCAQSGGIELTIETSDGYVVPYIRFNYEVANYDL